jgi:EAL domain-containing protein (putative c-di-GMP-specific phosphodiesterase class I)
VRTRARSGTRCRHADARRRRLSARGRPSLRHLRALLPVDTLKIDKSFVDGIAGDESDAAILESVVHLARHLGVEAVAEGVETAAHAERLRGFGCALAQGYHFARPMTPDAVRRMLDDQSAAARLSAARCDTLAPVTGSRRR